MKLIVILIVLVLLALGLRMAIPRLGHSVAGGVVESDGHQALAECPATPNCHRDEFPISSDPAQAMQSLADIVTQQQGAQIISQDERYLHATFSTPVMGFIDDVEFLLDTGNAEAQPRILVRSASRLGKSDLGANAKRIEELRSAGLGRL